MDTSNLICRTFLMSILGPVLTLAPSVRAATVCVFDTDDLIAELEIAEDNGEDDVLLLVEGVYTPPPWGLVYQSSEGKSLSIVGGYVAAGSNCTKDGPRPGQTIIVAPAATHALAMFDSSPSAPATPTYELEDLVFADGSDGWSFDNVASSISHNLTIERVVHENLAGRSFFANLRGTLRFSNNLVVANGSAASPASTGGVVRLQGSQSTGFVTHNTFSRNRFQHTGSALNVWCDGGDATINVTNNVIRDNGTITPDLNVKENCDFSLRFNSYSNLVGTADTSCCNTNLMPVFVDPVNSDYRLRWDSTLRDVGDMTPPGGLPAADFWGYPRPDGLLPDLGAHEFPWIFADGFETANTAKWSAAVP